MNKALRNWLDKFACVNGKDEERERRVTQNLRILNDFGWLWQVRNAWSYREKITIHNIGDERDEPYQALKDILEVDSSRLTQSNHEVWVHYLGRKSETVERVSPTGKHKSSWAFFCLEVLQSDCGNLQDIVVVKKDDKHPFLDCLACFDLYHQKESASSVLLNELVRKIVYPPERSTRFSMSMTFG